MNIFNFLHGPVARLALLGGLAILLTATPAWAQGGVMGGSPGGGSTGGGSSGITGPFQSSSTTNPGGAAQSYSQGLFGNKAFNVVGPTTANPFLGYYANPYSIGMPQQQKTSGSQQLNGTTNATPSFGVATNYVNSTGGTSTGSTVGTGTGSSSIGGMKSGNTSGLGSGSSGLGSSSTGYGSSSSGLGTGSKTGTTGLGGTTGGLGSGGKALGSTSGLGSSGGPGMGGAGAGSTSYSQGFTTIGSQKTPQPYITVPGNIPLAGPPQPGSLHFKVSQLIQSSSKLPSKNNIQVGMQGQTVVLSGTVMDEHERLLTEGIIRLTPGVKNVVNNLAVQGSPTGP